MPVAKTVRRPLVMVFIMVSLFMIAIEATIVSTAMPQIAGQLGDLHLYSWVFSAFLLTQTATTVVFGKLSDLYGRRPVLLAGILVFLAGSVLCGFAWSIPSLIVFRLVQGVGAGAIQPIGLTVVGDLYSAQERGKIQGYLASVWGISSVLGPLAGGLIIGQFSWPWIFWINVPVALIAMAGLAVFLHESVEREKHHVDVVGAALFTLAVAALMVALTKLGDEDRFGLIAVGVFLAAALLFVLQERRAADPMIVFRLWARRPIATANAATLLSGMAIIGLTAFLPMYVQGVLGRSPLVAGFALTMMVLGWPIGATLAAKNFGRFGLRATMLLGAALMPIGGLAFLLLGPNTPPVVPGCGSFIMGLGMGFFSTSAIVLIQDCVGWTERGAATASNIFSRSLGSALGAAVLGGVLNVALARHADGAAGIGFDQVRQLLDQPASVTGEAAVRLALGDALHITFAAVFGITLVTFVLATLVPRVAIKAGPREVVVE